MRWLILDPFYFLGKAEDRRAVRRRHRVPDNLSAHLCTRIAKDHGRRKGLNDENILFPGSREKDFLLTLPFIEPAHVKCCNYHPTEERRRDHLGRDQPSHNFPRELMR